MSDTITVTVKLTEAEYLAAVDQVQEMREACLLALGEALTVLADELVREMETGR